jgi:hypothetical protein
MAVILQFTPRAARSPLLLAQEGFDALDARLWSENSAWVLAEFNGHPGTNELRGLASVVLQQINKSDPLTFERILIAAQEAEIDPVTLLARCMAYAKLQKPRPLTSRR